MSFIFDFHTSEQKVKCRVKIFYTLLLLNQMTNMAVCNVVIKTSTKDTNNITTNNTGDEKELNFDFAFDEINLISVTTTYFCQTKNLYTRYENKILLLATPLKWYQDLNLKLPYLGD